MKRIIVTLILLLSFGGLALAKKDAVESGVETTSEQFKHVDKLVSEFVQKSDFANFAQMESDYTFLFNYLNRFTRTQNMMPAVRWYAGGQLMTIYSQAYFALEPEIKDDTHPLENRKLIPRKILETFFGEDSCFELSQCAAQIRNLREFATIIPLETEKMAHRLERRSSLFQDSPEKTYVKTTAQNIAALSQILFRCRPDEVAPSKFLEVKNKETLRSCQVIANEQLKRIQTAAKEAPGENMDWKDQEALFLGLHLYLQRWAYTTFQMWVRTFPLSIDSYENEYGKKAVAHALTLFPEIEMKLPTRVQWQNLANEYIKENFKDDSYFKNRLKLLQLEKVSAESEIQEYLKLWETPQALISEETDLENPHFEKTSLIEKLRTTAAFALVAENISNQLQSARQASYKDDIRGIEHARVKLLSHDLIMASVSLLRHPLELHCAHYIYNSVSDTTTIKLSFDPRSREMKLNEVCTATKIKNNPDVTLSVEHYLNQRMNDELNLEAFGEGFSNPFVSGLSMVFTSWLTNKVVYGLVGLTGPWASRSVQSWYAYRMAQKELTQFLKASGLVINQGQFKNGVAAAQRWYQNTPNFADDFAAFSSRYKIPLITNFLVHKVLSATLFTGIHKGMAWGLSGGLIPFYDPEESFEENFGQEILWGVAIFTVTPYFGKKAERFTRNRIEAYEAKHNVWVSENTERLSLAFSRIASDTVVFTAIPYAQRIVKQFEKPKDDKHPIEPIWQGQYDFKEHFVSSITVAGMFKKNELLKGLRYDFGHFRRKEAPVEKQEPKGLPAGSAP